MSLFQEEVGPNNRLYKISIKFSKVGLEYIRFVIELRVFAWLIRKNRMKRVIRVPAVSAKLADIPPDDYSWRKYGQKPIKGSPHPRCVIFALDHYLCFHSFGLCVVK